MAKVMPTSRDTPGHRRAFPGMGFGAVDDATRSSSRELRIRVPVVFLFPVV